MPFDIFFEASLVLTGGSRRRQAMILCLFFVFSMTVFSARAEEGLVGYWKFDEGEGIKTADSSGNGNHGLLKGNPQWVTGKTGGALRFDGEDDCIDCGNDASLNMPSREITISVWLKSEARDGWARRVVSKKVSWTEYEGYELTFRTSTSRPEIGGSGPSYASGIAEGLNDGEWHHIAGTIRDTGTSIEAVVYADGRDIGGERTSAPIKIGENRLYIGCISGGGGNFKGTIDEVRIYDRALTETEIRSIYERR